jgi:hypothetical protein
MEENILFGWGYAQKILRTAGDFYDVYGFSRSFKETQSRETFRSLGVKQLTFFVYK